MIVVTEQIQTLVHVFDNWWLTWEDDLKHVDLLVCYIGNVYIILQGRFLENNIAKSLSVKLWTKWPSFKVRWKQTDGTMPSTYTTLSKKNWNMKPSHPHPTCNRVVVCVRVCNCVCEYVCVYTICTQSHVCHFIYSLHISNA